MERAGDAAGRLLDPLAELLVVIAAQLREDDELAAALACKLREAAEATERRGQAHSCQQASVRC
jgi:hypothetical protein